VRARREVEAQAKRMLMQGLELMVGEADEWGFTSGPTWLVDMYCCASV